MVGPEPMNATSQHAKIKVSIEFSDPLYVAGQEVTGKFDIECKTDKDLAIGVIKTELLAVQELASRDHSASNTFIHQTRLFQGPSLPPSNAVHAHPQVGANPLPDNYYPARKGTTTFFFRFQLPTTTPASINFAKGLAKLKYEVRTSVGVIWKDERQLVTDKKELEVIESPGEPSQGMEQVVIGENGKLWAQARITNSFLVSGQSACVELFVKNHSMKKTASLVLSLSRHLKLDSAARPNKILDISDTLLSQPFKGPDYIVYPGTEGIANLVFNIPRSTRGVRSGPMYVEDDDESFELPSLFHIQCLIVVKIGMGIGSKDVTVELPVTIVHPAALQAYGFQEQLGMMRPISPPVSPILPNTSYADPYHTALPQSPPLFSPYQSTTPYQQPVFSPPISPVQQQQNFWPPMSPLPISSYDYSQYYYYPPALGVPYMTPPRPSSAGPYTPQQLPPVPPSVQASPINLASPHSQISYEDGEVGKGERASRITARLHRSSRNRSVSPLSHRFPVQATEQQDLHPYESTTISKLDASPTSPTWNAGVGRANLSPIDVTYSGEITNLASPAAKLHSPRPMLSPKHSFSWEKGGTNKSLRVEQLEKMAAEVLEAEDQEQGKEVDSSSTEVNVFKTSQRPNDEQIYERDLPPPPVPSLKPFRIVPELRNRQNGLEALEQRLLQSVGTVKEEKEERHLTGQNRNRSKNAPVEVTSASAGLPNSDSAISILALGFADANIENGKESNSNITAKASGATATTKSTKASPKRLTPERLKEKGRKSEAQQLRKAATGRVSDWLGSVVPQAPPASSGAAPESVGNGALPSSSSTITKGTRDPEQKRSTFTGGNNDNSEANTKSFIDRRVPNGSVKSNFRDSTLKMSPVPRRSSGFVLHRSENETAPFESTLRRSVLGGVDENGNGEVELRTKRIEHNDKPRAIVRTAIGSVANTGAEQSQTEPLVRRVSHKPVLSRYAPALDKVAKPATRSGQFIAESTRGGRGGKVTTVAAMWASLAENQGTNMNGSRQSRDKTDKPTSAHSRTSSSTLKATNSKNQILGKSQKPSPIAKRKILNSNPLVANLADRSPTRPAVVKSTSVPAVISSSLAKPVLSSTASLARPVSPTNRRQYPPTPAAKLFENVKPDVVPSAKPPTAVGSMAFGQARLKDLIRKYQEGFGK